MVVRDKLAAVGTEPSLYTQSYRGHEQTQFVSQDYLIDRIANEEDEAIKVLETSGAMRFVVLFLFFVRSTMHYRCTLFSGVIIILCYEILPLT